MFFNKNLDQGMRKKASNLPACALNSVSPFYTKTVHQQCNMALFIVLRTRIFKTSAETYQAFREV